MFRGLIDAAVERALARRIVAPDKRLYPAGYNPLSVIKGALFEWLYVPFNGENILIEVRYPNYTQLMAGGYDFGQILLEAEKELSAAEQLEVMNAQEWAAKCVMNRPTYEEFEGLVYAEDNTVGRRRARLAELRGLLATADVSATARADFARELEELEYFVGILLPTDTMATLTRIALGADVSDVKKLTRETLEQAWYKSQLYHQAAHEFIAGVFTDRDAAEVDALCAALGAERATHAGKDRPRGNHFAAT
jgi:hypothetical protein